MPGITLSKGAQRTEGPIKHTLHSFFAHHRPEQRRPCNTLGLLQTFVERRAKRTRSTTYLARHCEDSIERPWCAVIDAFVGIVRGVEDRDKDMTA